MSLVRKFRAITGSDLAGEPSDGKSASWQLPCETLSRKWVEVPVTATGGQETSRLIEPPDNAMLEEWRRVEKT